MSFAGLKRIFSTTSFRLTFFSLTLLWLLVGVLLAGIYLVTRDLMESDTIEQLELETAMAGDWIAEQPLNNNQLIELLRQEDDLFILFSADRQVLYASVERFQITDRDSSGLITLTAPAPSFGWAEAPYPESWRQQTDDDHPAESGDDNHLNEADGEYQASTDGEETTYYALATELSDGRTLWLGRDIGYLKELIALLETVLQASWALMLLLSAAVSIAITRRALRRIDAINSTCSAIETGSLQLRIACREDGDEYDRLAASINRMLDRIEVLLEDVRRVSDQIAHELRTPLTRLHEQIQQLCEHPDSLRHQQQASAEVERVLATFNTLLRISRIESGALAGTDSEFDLRNLLGDLTELYQPLLEEKGGELITTLPTHPLPVRGDSNLWFQCFSNLLDNSLKYCPTPVRIGIRVEQLSPLQLSISDNGPGIPTPFQQQVLSRFFRLERDKQQPGYGLGLTFVAAICDYHHVRLSLSNEQGLKVLLQWPQA